MSYPQKIDVGNNYDISDLVVLAIMYEKYKLYLIPPEKVYFLSANESKEVRNIAAFWEKEKMSYLSFLLRDVSYLAQSSVEFRQDNLVTFYAEFLAKLPEKRETTHFLQVLFNHSKFPSRSNRQRAVNFLDAVKILNSIFLNQLRENYKTLKDAQHTAHENRTK